jgi:hypothetical protein
MIEKLSVENITTFITNLPTWVIVLGCIVVFMGIVGQWALYSKCELPGFAALVPAWNVIIFLRIVGRPATQSWLVMIPPALVLGLILFVPNLMIASAISAALIIPWSVFMVKVYIEVCHCFGKHSVVSYVLIVLLNGMYLFNLALSEDEKYNGPVYGKTKQGAGQPAAA